MFLQKARVSHVMQALILVLLSCVLTIPAPVSGESLELRLNQISGLTKDVKGRTEYLIAVYECSPICSLMGVESLAEKNEAHVLSNDGIHGSFRLSIKLRRRTRPPPQKRVAIPVEVVEPESALSDSPELDSSVAHFAEAQSSFELYGRVMLTGSQPGEKGNLNHNWRDEEVQVAEYIIDTTTSAIRRCRKSCRFHSDSPFVRKVLSNETVDAPKFDLELTAFRETATEKSTAAHLLFAGHFAEAVEKSLKQDLILPFPFPGQSQTPEADRSGSVSRFENNECNKFRFVTTVGDDVAYVWYLSTDKTEDTALKRNRLDTGPTQGLTIVGFKDIEKSTPSFAKTWGHSELSPVGFVGSTPYKHFESFGKVHKGFHNLYNEISEELRTWIRPGANVLVTGVFAGGALASLAYVDWLADKDMDVGVSYGVTFAAPQVGDKLFQKAVRELGRYEPSKAKLGFFEQVVAADENTGRVDISSTLPSIIFESVVPYPGVHSIDCLRSILPVERMALCAPGHLRTYRSVGKRRFLYAGRRLRSSPGTRNMNLRNIDRRANDSLGDMASSVFFVHGNLMDHYMERLFSLYFDIQQIRQHEALRTGAKVLLENTRTEEGIAECQGNSLRYGTETLSVHVEVASEKGMLSISKALGMSVCGECSKGRTEGYGSCRPLLISGDAAALGDSISEREERKFMSFISLRPVAKTACIQFHSNKMYKPPTCASDLLPKERVQVAASPMIEVKEILSCGRDQRCQMKLDGMTLLISGELQSLHKDPEVSTGTDRVKEGVLMRGSTTIVPTGMSGGVGLISGTYAKGGVRARVEGTSTKDRRENTVGFREGVHKEAKGEDSREVLRMQDVLSGKCENDSYCKCLSRTVSNCASPVPGQLGWCSVQSCEELQCSCDGIQICEKHESVVFHVIESIRGVKFARCESRIGIVSVASSQKE